MRNALYFKEKIRKLVEARESINWLAEQRYVNTQFHDDFVRFLDGKINLYNTILVNEGE